MRANQVRTLYDYHFTLNRRLWDTCIVPLSDEQFVQHLDYSVGSIRNQIVHMMSVDERWFSGLRGVAVPSFLNPVHYPNRMKIRDYWDRVERDMRAYLDLLTDEQVNGRFAEFAVWEVLLHVANHGTDHRAQTLAMLHHLGAPTMPQDLIFYLMKR